MPSTNSVKICFVCLGNICRSPLAQGVFETLIAKENFQGLVHIESAGTGNWHVGKRPDKRMQATARKNSVDMNSLARQFQPEDFDRFDLVIAMDQANFMDLAALCNPTTAEKKLKLFRSFDPENLSKQPSDVPDPYYGGDEGFDNVFNIVHRTSPKILEFIKINYLNC
jgi:protein-tyrosine phosphatase